MTPDPALAWRSVGSAFVVSATRPIERVLLAVLGMAIARYLV